MSQRYRKASITLLFTGAALSLLSGFLLVSASIDRSRDGRAASDARISTLGKTEGHSR